METIKLLDEVAAARRAGMPFIAVTSLDPTATITSLNAGLQKETYDLNGNGGDEEEAANQFPALRWNCVSGMEPLNALGRAALGALEPALSMDEAAKVTSPADVLAIAANFPADTLLAMVGMDRFLNPALAGVDPSFSAVLVQSVSNLRNVFKSDGRTLLLLGPDFTFPIELVQDVMTFNEQLPDRKTLRSIVVETLVSAEAPPATPEVLEEAVDGLRGLSNFAAESIVSMSLEQRVGAPIFINTSKIWDRKKKLIRQTNGLTVYDGEPFRNRETGELERRFITFKDVGGNDEIKKALREQINGPAKPKLVVWVDEVEKGFAGSVGPVSDNTGAAQAILNEFLVFMENTAADGYLLYGVPGSGKSMIAKAIGGEANVLTIAFNIGELKQSALGSTEANVRNAFKTITAIADTDVLFVGTCNRDASLPTELYRRFASGQYYFDNPSRLEREVIWPIFQKEFGFENEVAPLDIPFTGAEIRNVCRLAWKRGITLARASECIIPVTISRADDLNALRARAKGNFLSAAYPGPYRLPAELRRITTGAEAGKAKARKIVVPASDPESEQ
jgi:hypothetical protein